jgi:hypothetical protein
MKHKIFALFTVGLMLLNLTGFAVADNRNAGKKKAQTADPLVALLP